MSLIHNMAEFRKLLDSKSRFDLNDYYTAQIASDAYLQGLRDAGLPMQDERYIAAKAVNQELRGYAAETLGFSIVRLA